MTRIYTFTGKTFDLSDPWQDDISIEDIAHSLSMLARFNGHTEQFYSVAQHSVLVARHVSKEAALAALLHDAAEAYVGDVVSPLKKMLTDFSAIESKIAASVEKAFDVSFSEHEGEIHESDRRALATEIRDL